MQRQIHTSPPDPAEVRKQLEHMLRGETFRYSHRMCRLLRFLVEHILDCGFGPLKEYLIGLRVFDRPESFDPRTDPIVRVEASRLRAKLRDYYLGEGAGDPVMIRLPKRGYHPEFLLQPPSAAEGGATVEKAGDLRTIGIEPLTEGPSLASVAVLPFLDLSPGHTEEYYCDGLTEELINTLARVEGLAVVSRTSVFQLKGATLDLIEIAKRLHVSAIVEGSVRRAGDTIRVSVQLLDAATGYHLWAETYERLLDNVFVVQSEIAAAIAGSLTGKLSPPPPAVARPFGETRSWAAYQHYLHGLHAWNRRTEVGFGKAIHSLRLAIREDPEYAAAWGRLAQSHLGLLLSSVADPRQVIPEAQSAAERALSLAPDMAEAWAAAGFLGAIQTRRWQQVEADFQRALELSPANPTVHEWYALAALLPQSQLDRAIAELRTAVDLDPVSAVLHHHLGLSLYFAGQSEEAIQEFELALELEPGFYRACWDLGMVQLRRSETGLAMESFHRARLLNPGSLFRLGSLGYGYARAGHLEKALATLDELLASRAEGYVSPVCLAEIHLGLDDHERAIDCLEQAAEHGSQRLIWLGVDPVFDPLRKAQRFQRLCDRIPVLPGPGKAGKVVPFALGKATVE